MAADPKCRSLTSSVSPSLKCAASSTNLQQVENPASLSQRAICTTSTAALPAVYSTACRSRDLQSHHSTSEVAPGESDSLSLTKRHGCLQNARPSSCTAVHHEATAAAAAAGSGGHHAGAGHDVKERGCSSRWGSDVNASVAADKQSTRRGRNKVHVALLRQFARWRSAIGQVVQRTWRKLIGQAFQRRSKERSGPVKEGLCNTCSGEEEEEKDGGGEKAVVVAAAVVDAKKTHESEGEKDGEADDYAGGEEEEEQQQQQVGGLEREERQNEVPDTESTAGAAVSEEDAAEEASGTARPMVWWEREAECHIALNEEELLFLFGEAVRSDCEEAAAADDDVDVDEVKAAAMEVTRSADDLQEEKELIDSKGRFKLVVEEMKIRFGEVASSCHESTGSSSSDVGIIQNSSSSSSSSSSGGGGGGGGSPLSPPRRVSELTMDDLWVEDKAEEAAAAEIRLQSLEDLEAAFERAAGFGEQMVLPLMFRMMNSVQSRYCVGEELGRGGQGKVFRAVDKASGEEVAVKVLSKRMMAAWGVEVGEMRREIHAMLAMRSHPHVLALLAAHETANNLYIVSELCDGGSLYDLMEQTSLSSRLAWLEHLKQLAGIMSALAFCHARGIIHRDVKPDNILVKWMPSHDPSQAPIPQLKLADWGLCTFFEGVGSMTQEAPAGSEYFFAPEIVQMWETGEGAYGEKVDTFAAGRMMEVLWEGIGLPLHLRLLLKGMTREKAEERMAADEVVERLREFCCWRWF